MNTQWDDRYGGSALRSSGSDATGSVARFWEKRYRDRLCSELALLVETPDYIIFDLTRRVTGPERMAARPGVLDAATLGSATGYFYGSPPT